MDTKHIISSINLLIEKTGFITYLDFDEVISTRNRIRILIEKVFGSSSAFHYLKELEDLDFKHMTIGDGVDDKKELWENDKKQLINYLERLKSDVEFVLTTTETLESITDLPTIVILTAIKEEYIAVRNHLVSLLSINKDGTLYEIGLFEFNSIKVAKIIIRECGATNINAVQDTERAIYHFAPKMIFFVGIAGSRKPKDFKVGDVIFPTKVYYYEGGKSEEKIFNARPNAQTTSFVLEEIAKRERLSNDWKTLIKNVDNEIIETVCADLGVIASGEKLVEHYNSIIGEILTTHYNDTAAVEMEGFGFANVVRRQGGELSNIYVGIVRGISDEIKQPEDDPNDPENEKENIDKRPKEAKQLASNTAAAFAYWIIQKAIQQKVLQ